MKRMSKKQHNIGLDYIQRVIDVQKIDPSPYQIRKYFDEDRLKELAATIQREGLIGPIVVRPRRLRPLYRELCRPGMPSDKVQDKDHDKVHDLEGDMSS